MRAARRFWEHRTTGVSLEAVEVYLWCMSRTNIDVDDDAVAAVMRRYGLQTKRDAVNYALRVLAQEPMDVDEALAMEGRGWEGDLDEMRASRIS
jgi:Arc/MetJ family transcription regulator